MKIFNGITNFPTTGDREEIYLDSSTGVTYYWSGNAYVPTQISTQSNPLLNSSGNGAKVGATVTAVERGDGVTHKTILTLTATPITLTDDAGVGQYGSIELYNFPAGNIATRGAVLDARLTLNETWWVDTTEGDVGVGTTAVTDGNALATTEQNIIPTTAVAALVAQAGSIACQSTGALVTGAAGGTDAKAYLNVRIDDSALHMPDIVTNGTFDTDVSWTKGTGWTIDVANSNRADSDGTQVAVSDLSQAIAALVPGVSYIIGFTTTRTAGSITPVVGGTVGTARTSAATFAETIVAGSDGILLFRASDDFVGSVDTVTATPTTGTGTITGTLSLSWENLGDIA